MASMIDSPLFGGLFTTEEIRQIWSDETTIQKWLDVEAALVRAEAKLGIIPKKHAQEITRKARVELIDMEEMNRQLFHPLAQQSAILRREPSVAMDWAGRTTEASRTRRLFPSSP